MGTLNEKIHGYTKHVEEGEIKAAYQGLMEYLSGLRRELKEKRPDYNVASSFYQGKMDLSFFSFSPDFFRERNLKISLVYLHDTGQFEAWLNGRNKEIQMEYKSLLKKKDLGRYLKSVGKKNRDSIVSSVLISNPNFDHQIELTNGIIDGLSSFIVDMEVLLK